MEIILFFKAYIEQNKEFFIFIVLVILMFNLTKFISFLSLSLKFIIPSKLNIFNFNLTFVKRNILFFLIGITIGFIITSTINITILIYGLIGVALSIIYEIKKNFFDT